MANDFSKEISVAFEELVTGFNDALVLSKAVKVNQTDDMKMVRANDTIWRPQPYIMPVYDGTDATDKFKNVTQLSVPATIGFPKFTPWAMSARELSDALQEKRLGDAAKQALSSAINVAVMNTVANQATLVVKRTAAATGFDDIAQCEGIMNRIGVPGAGRHIALSTKDYNGMANNLATRASDNSRDATAYSKALISTDIASFTALKLDYANRIAAKAHTGLTIDTRASASNYYVPKGISVSATGEMSNVDNRYQTITPSATTSVVAGDCITIDGVYEVHHITKQSTGELKTFRVISVGSSTMVISPPIISAQGGSLAEIQYQNCSVTTSATAAITGLNTVAANINPFWVKDAVELLPARYSVPMNAGAKVMRATTDNGIEISMESFYDINTKQTLFRADVLFGVALLAPEQAGLMLFSQT